jgi:DNA-binding beta-propeller fold protein YncE
METRVFRQEGGAMKYLMVVLAMTLGAGQSSPPPVPYLIGKVSLPGVEGRFDHLSIDIAHRTLFVAALGNDTVEVVDIGSLKTTASIRGFDEPQGISYIPARNTVLVANGGTGVVNAIDAATRQIRGTVRLPGDADNVRVDAASGLAYVGYGGGALAVLDQKDAVAGNIPLDGHPESFQLEIGGPRVFVNVPSAGHIAVVDRVRRAVVAKWPVTAAGANYPMALDESHHRLFVGCRSPARLLVYDTGTGKMTTNLPIAGDTDDLFYDAARRRIYVAGGEGAITVIEQQDGDHYRVVNTVPTAAGARTALFVPELHRLFIAVPHRGAQPSGIWVYSTE